MGRPSLDEKISEFISDAGLYFNITQDRKFNVYSTYGIDKSDYYIIHDANLISCSQCVLDYNSIINQVYVLNQFQEDVIDESTGEETQIDRFVTYIAEDKDSIRQFGLRQEVLQVNDLRNLETAKHYAENELLKLSQPIVNINLDVKICDELNIYDIKPGDTIYIDSELLNVHQPVKVMEYTVDIQTQTVNIILGNTVFRKNEYIQYRM